jgi:steroid delta-isomerase-like uncharacterized protein
MESKVLKEAAEALASLDAESLVSLYADDFVFEDTASGECITKKTDLRKYFDRLFSLPEVQFPDVRFFSCGDKGAGEWTWTGKSIRSGKDYSVRGASLFILGQGCILRETIFYDPRAAYE